MIESPLSEAIKARKRNIKKLSVSRCDEDSAPAITSRLHNEAGKYSSSLMSSSIMSNAI